MADPSESAGGGAHVAHRGLAQAFEISFGGNQSANLQESFRNYRRGRQAEIKQFKKMQASQPCCTQPSVQQQQHCAELRNKFVEQAKTYLGVPYAKKYWTPEEPEYNAHLFLDCCGLVRQVLRDLRKDLGFKCGRWNQAYQYDTLPTSLHGPEEAKPGDLVFISGIYNNPKAKRQIHDIVHVEIWLGEGEKTIGARWQRGHVQVFDSYKFEPKAYHSPVYKFKSIDTWLHGTCKSHCPEHLWRVSAYDPMAKSIFAEDDSDDSAGDDDLQSAGDPEESLCATGDEEGSSCCRTITSSAAPSASESLQLPFRFVSLQETNSQYSRSNNGCMIPDDEDKENQPYTADTPPDDDGTGDSSLPAAWTTHATETSKPNGTRRRAAGDKKPDPNENNNNGGGGPGRGGKGNGGSSLQQSNNTPLFYIAGGNGASLVEAPLVAIGWRRTTDKRCDSWKLKWVELNSSIAWSAFKDGEQLVNRIPNCHLLTNKLGLYNSLSEYHRVTMALKGGRVKLRLEEFVPETYRIDESKDRETFLSAYQEGEIWICKPTGLNQGKGIYLIRSREEIDRMLTEREEKHSSRRTKPPMSRIVQRYITKPLLVEGRKFDIRCYMLIASTVPYLVLYHRGYVRVTCDRYHPDSVDLTNHLTNQFMQKKRDDYKELKDDTVWTMERLNKYINENCREKAGIEEDWIHNTFDKKCMAIMKYCFNSVRHKLSCRLGYFDLYGFDFMIDQDMGVWLIEINVNPALHVNCEVLKDVIPPIIEQTLYVALECFDKSKKGQPLLPLQSLRTFEVLYNGDKKSGGGSNGGSVGGGETSPARGGSPKPKRSTSPSKDAQPGWGYINRTAIRPGRAVVGLSLPAAVQPGLAAASGAGTTGGEAGAVAAAAASTVSMYVIPGYPSHVAGGAVAAAPSAGVANALPPSAAATGHRADATGAEAAAAGVHSLSPATELAEARAKTPRLPQLYNVRTDVAAGRQHADEGGSGISVVKLRMMHAEHPASTAEQHAAATRPAGWRPSRRAPVDRSS